MDEKKPAVTMTIREIRTLFETSRDPDVVRDCVRAIGAGVGGVFGSEVDSFQKEQAVRRLVAASKASR